MSEAKWIVKSSGRILGPVTIEEIIESMRTKTFSVLDEVREPHSRWTFLREHPMLVGAVRQIRDEQSSGVENTQSTFVTSGKTITSSVTERIMEEAELTPNPTVPQPPGMRSINATEKNVAISASGAKSFGVLSDQRVQNKIQKQSSQWKAIVYAVAAIAVVGAGAYWKMQAGSGLSVSQAADAIRLANDFAKVGEYDKAYVNLKQVEAARGLSTMDKLFKLKVLLAKQDSNPLEMTQTMDELRAKGQGEVNVNLDLLSGLTMAREGRRDAQASYRRALDQNPTSEEALLDLAAWHLNAREIARAWRLLQNARISEFRPYYQVLKSLVVLQFEDPKSQQEFLGATYEEFRDFDSALDQQLFAAENSGRTQRPDTVKAGDYGRDLRFERLMLTGLMAQKLGRIDDVKVLRQKLVQSSPFESAKYLRSPLLDRQILDWNRFLSGPCDALVKGFPVDEATGRGIAALCEAAAGDLVSARNLIESANRQFRGDASLAGIDALLLVTSGRDSEAERIVQMYAVTNRILLHWVRGEVCEKKRDSSCAERAWTQVKTYDPYEPRAFFGMAKAAKDLMNDTIYIENVAMGPKYAPNYAPMLSLTGSRNEF